MSEIPKMHEAFIGLSAALKMARVNPDRVALIASGEDAEKIKAALDIFAHSAPSWDPSASLWSDYKPSEAGEVCRFDGLRVKTASHIEALEEQLAKGKEINHEWATSNEHLRARNKKLEEALAPFAAAATNFDRMPIKDPTNWFAYQGQEDHKGVIGAITVADLRAARAALSSKGE